MAGGSPLVGPLLGGVIRSDDLGLGHHPVLVLGEGVAVWVEMGGVKVKFTEIRGVACSNRKGGEKVTNQRN